MSHIPPSYDGYMRLFIPLVFITFLTGVLVGQFDFSIFDSFQQQTCDSKGNCRFTITPKKIVLRIISKEAFQKNEHVGEMSGFRAAAYTMINYSPCEIRIPEGATIESVPAYGRASWGYDSESYYLRDTLAHEILHCYTGIWHQRWWQINWKKVIEDKDQMRDWENRYFISIHSKPICLKDIDRSLMQLRYC